MDEKSINEACKQIMVMIKAKKEEKGKLEETYKKGLAEVTLKFDTEASQHKKELKIEEQERKLYIEGVENLSRTYQDIVNDVESTRQVTNDRIRDLENEIQVDQDAITKIETSIKDSRVSDLEKEVVEVKMKFNGVNDQYGEFLMKSLDLEGQLKSIKAIINQESENHARLENELLTILEKKKDAIIKFEEDLDVEITKHIEKENIVKREENEVKRELNEVLHLVELEAEKNKIMNQQLKTAKDAKSKNAEVFERFSNEESNLLAQITENEMLLELAKSKLAKILTDNANLPPVPKILEEKTELYGTFEKVSEKLAAEMYEQSKYVDEAEAYAVETLFIKTLMEDAYRNQKMTQQQLDDLKTTKHDIPVDSFVKLNAEYLDLKRNIRFKTDEFEDLKLRLNVLENREARAQADIDRLNRNEMQAKVEALEEELTAMRLDLDELKAFEEQMIQTTDTNKKDIEEKKRVLNMEENRLLHSINDLETQIKQKNQLYEIEVKKISRFQIDIEEKKGQISIKEQSIEDTKQRLEELESMLKPKLDIVLDESIEVKIKSEPVNALKDGVILLLRRISENSIKYKARDIIEITSGVFDPSIQCLFDRVILPSLMEIFHHGFETSWWTGHFWKLLEKIVYEGKAENKKFIECLNSLMDQTRSIVYNYTVDYNQMARIFFALSFAETSLFTIIDGFLKEESLIKSYYVHDSIIRNSDLASRIRSLAIILSKTTFKLKIVI